MKLYSRPGNDLTGRFPLIVEALGRLRSRSCIISTARRSPATGAASPSSIASVIAAMTAPCSSTLSI